MSISNPDKEYLPNFHLKFGDLKDTPLHQGCRSGSIEIVKMLLEATTDHGKSSGSHKLDSDYLLLKNADGLTAFHLAVYYKYIHIVECFRDMVDETALQEVTSTKDSVHNETPLIYAISKGYDTSFIQILASISDLNVSSKYTGSESIHFSIGNSRNYAAPPLVVAASRNDIEVVKVLLLLDIDINQLNDRGLTAISVAAKNGYADLCELLASHGADLMLTKLRGGAPMQRARRYKHWNVVEILEKYGAT